MHVKVLVASLVNKDNTKAGQGFVVQVMEQGSFYQKNGSTGRRRRSKSKLNRPKRAVAQSLRGMMRENNWTGSGLPVHPCARTCGIVRDETMLSSITVFVLNCASSSFAWQWEACNPGRSLEVGCSHF
jgi:hypothetical protein